MTARSEAFFAAAGAGPLAARHAIWRAPDRSAPSALVVYVHPLAEEMNKTRRMAALQARALADGGHAVLQMDLLGCGDSAGDFGDATWGAWVQDVQDACQLAQDRYRGAWPGEPLPPLWLWGLRAGCLLAVAAASRLSVPCNLLFWQPQASGKQALQQLLRLKTAAAALDGDARAVASQVRADLAAGCAVDVAGYALSAALAAGMERATLDPPQRAGRAVWLDVCSADPPAPLPPTSTAAERWRAAGWQVEAAGVRGPAFWSTVEVETAPDLLHATLAALCGNGPSQAVAARAAEPV